MIHFTHLQTFPKIPKSRKIPKMGQKFQSRDKISKRESTAREVNQFLASTQHRRARSWTLDRPQEPCFKSLVWPTDRESSPIYQLWWHMLNQLYLVISELKKNCYHCKHLTHQFLCLLIIKLIDSHHKCATGRSMLVNNNKGSWNRTVKRRS